MKWAYVAGYFDGEGNVALYPYKSKTRTGCVTRMTFYNTHLESLEAIQTFMGVGRISKRMHSGFGGKKQAYQLEVTRKVELLRIIENMIPHLIIKREATIALRDYLIKYVDETRMDNFGKAASISDEQLKRWHYDEGKSVGEIARLVGVGSPAISHTFKLRGIQTLPRKSAKGIPKSAETRAKMKAAQAEYWSDPSKRETKLAKMFEGKKTNTLTDANA